MCVHQRKIYGVCSLSTCKGKGWVCVSHGLFCRTQSNDICSSPYLSAHSSSLTFSLLLRKLHHQPLSPACSLSPRISLTLLPAPPPGAEPAPCGAGRGRAGGGAWGGGGVANPAPAAPAR